MKKKEKRDREKEGNIKKSRKETHTSSFDLLEMLT